jgi:hypothetical protein
MKGAYTTEVRPEAAEEILNYVTKLPSEIGVKDIAFVFEYFPVKKAPEDSTAYVRGDWIGTVCSFKWESEIEIEKIRSAANGLSAILIKAEDKLPSEKNTGYGNYGEYCSNLGFYSLTLHY